MKNTILIIAIFLFFGCDKYLEVIPEYKLPAEFATSHIDSLQKITVGAFNQLQSGNLYGGGLIANSELLSDNWNASPISDFSFSDLFLILIYVFRNIIMLKLIKKLRIIN